jgi:hypothetical protein
MAVLSCAQNGRDIVDVDVDVDEVVVKSGGRGYGRVESGKGCG